MRCDMTYLERYMLSVPAEKVWGYFWCHGCDECPAKEFCHGQPEGTCCRENFMEWAEKEQ